MCCRRRPDDDELQRAHAKLEAFQESATDGFISDEKKLMDSTDSARIERNEDRIAEIVNEMHSLTENNHLLRQMMERQTLMIKTTVVRGERVPESLSDV